MIGQVLSHRYEILEKVGEGGMAVTYRGRDRLLGRAVAVKVMKPELSGDAEFLARFRREARAAAGVIHGNVAGVYDTGSDGRYHYIVMEYVDGETLRDRVRREGPLPLEEALRIALETAEALEAAHSVGVVHRDIKPRNIMLGREGQVKVTDFGIARAMFATGHTETGKILGSVHYVSPEQARGDVVGPQGDIYSLGVTLYEMLTAKPVFQGGDRLAILHKHIYDRPPRVIDARPGLPHEVDFIVTHCLEKDLSRRFASARELSSYLLACPREESADWQQGWSPARLWARVRHYLRGGAGWVQQRAVLVGVVTVMLAALVVGVTWWASARGMASMVPVPDVLGMRAAAARECLRQEDLKYRGVGRRPSDDIIADAVISQDPAAGVKVAPGAVVKVVLSTGPRHTVVPPVTEMSLEQATRNLKAAGLAVEKVREEYHPKVPVGYVSGTLPRAGTQVQPGTKVGLIISLGPQPELPPAPPLPDSPDAGVGRDHPPGADESGDARRGHGDSRGTGL